ncbi:DUF2268 domain-containing putative Zn-dependent protease [Sutcliffiella rhizosphaerae]|uniref:DUF2268 domain-containing protein n=1 Tax=Sutcliffiella rhizosphaerae TaxID=2880967 RepID=A0ABN8AGY5_9BACI|nr:DUF2268 domain-containing putative Zn-dependent protease [Sutcliffiella rhizosphaerae]CAG9623519.1 hypothetical protein BACCIP111883_04335 [Sutcliffiella rhizosphaerae]
MRFTSFFFFLIMSVALVGCNNGGTGAGAEDLNVELEYTFENNGQEFEIIHAYELFNDFYAEGLKGDEATSLYNSSILDAVGDKCYKGGEFEQQADYILAPSKNRIAVQDNLKRMDILKINSAIKEALTKSSNELPMEGTTTTVCVFPTDNNASANIVTAGVGKIIVLYNRNTTDNLLKAYVSNKYHHSYWIDNHYNGETFTILDRLVMEGKGMAFQKTIYPNIDAAPVDQAFNKDLWNRIESDLETDNEKRAQEILTGGRNGLPSQYGYSESYKMVKSYLDANEGISLEDWTAAPSEEILAAHKANYN